MDRKVSLLVLVTAVFAMGAEAYSTSAPVMDASERESGQHQQVMPTLAGDTTSVDGATFGDNCGVDGYPWLDRDGQPLMSLESQVG